MRFERFQILIVSGPGEGFSLYVLSPHGEGRAPFTLPFDISEYPALAVGFMCAGSPEAEDTSGTMAQQRFLPEEIGERLFSSLFPGEILGLYERCVALSEQEPGLGLRIEVMLDPRDSRLLPFQALPWELLRQPGTPDFLALNLRRPIVRRLAVPRAASPSPATGRLRILVVAASPAETRLYPLDLQREARILGEATRAHPGLEIIWPSSPTLAAIRRACREQVIHILHFMGHGCALADTGEQVLLFETSEGRAEPVRGADLFNKLPDARNLILVFLNACNSGAQAEGPANDPFSGVATSLVLGGVPAVVAMRCPISDEAAIAFSGSFYGLYSAGESLEASMTEGRQAMHSLDPMGVEWAVPVLFQRGEASFARPASRKHRSTVAGLVFAGLLAIAVVLAARGWWIERMVTEGVDHINHGEWPEAIESFRSALKLAPGRAEILSNLAASEERGGNPKGAEEHYREAVDRSPGSARHLFDLGQFLNDRGRFQDAYGFLLQAAERAPDWADAHGELGRAALALGMLDEARAELRTALRSRPDSAALQRIQGELELKAGNVQAAIDSLRRAKSRYLVGELGQIETCWLLVKAYDVAGQRPSVCGEVEQFRRLDTARSTPWALRVESLAGRWQCGSR